MVDIINTKEQRTLNISTPKGCLVCGIKNEEYEKGHPGAAWLMITLDRGIVIFKCPNCHVAWFNPESFENLQKIRAWKKEDEEKLIKVASSPVDPRVLMAVNN